jgi:environmental stress-induced protein Ves
MFIYPSDGSFADRNFLFRISTATVETEESTFTFFEGITRHLMILKGELELIHEGRYSKYLKPFDQDTFSGEWPTRSNGKVTDFNLMLKDGAAGSLTHHTINPQNAAIFHVDAGFCFIYIVSGGVVLSDGSEARPGDLVQILPDSNTRMEGVANLVEIRVTLGSGPAGY